MTINGYRGTIVGTLTADSGCVISPGSSSGTLSIEGELIVAGGKIVLEVNQFGNHDVLSVAGSCAGRGAVGYALQTSPEE